MCQFNENTGGQKTAETFFDQNKYFGEFFFFAKKISPYKIRREKKIRILAFFEKFIIQLFTPLGCQGAIWNTWGPVEKVVLAGQLMSTVCVKKRVFKIV